MTDDNLESMFSEVYARARAVAERMMRDERLGHTLEPTALTHEAFLRLRKQNDIEYRSEQHLLAITAKMMRRVLLNYARDRLAKKRGGRRLAPTTLSGKKLVENLPTDELDVLALEAALQQLREEPNGKRKETVVEMAYFGGFPLREIASYLDVAERTINRDWAYSQAFLRRELSSEKWQR